MVSLALPICITVFILTCVIVYTFLRIVKMLSRFELRFINNTEWCIYYIAHLN